MMVSIAQVDTPHQVGTLFFTPPVSHTDFSLCERDHTPHITKGVFEGGHDVAVPHCW